MRATNELTISGEPAELSELLQRLDASLPNGWKRDRASEGRLRGMGIAAASACCLACPYALDRPAAALWIHARGPRELHVSTVVPLQLKTLSDDEYNRILAELQRDVLSPASQGLGVQTRVVQPRVRLEHYFSAEAIRKLKAFVETSTRTDLPSSDRDLWNSFVIQTHRDQTVLDEDVLDRWLLEEGWQADERRRFISEYKVARSLLAAYDEEPGR